LLEPVGESGVVAPCDALAVREAARALRLEVEQALPQRVPVVVRLPLGSTGEDRGNEQQQRDAAEAPVARGRSGATHWAGRVPARRRRRLLPPRHSHERPIPADCRRRRLLRAAALCGLSSSVPSGARAAYNLLRLRPLPDTQHKRPRAER
jgi:hypothetical protein